LRRAISVLDGEQMIHVVLWATSSATVAEFHRELGTLLSAGEPSELWLDDQALRLDQLLDETAIRDGAIISTTARRKRVDPGCSLHLRIVDPDRQPTIRTELFDGLLAHEDRYWASPGPHTPEDPQLRRRVVALATLTAARSEEEASEPVGLVPNLGRESIRERHYQLAAWAHALYHRSGWWNPVEPDLLGEHLVASTYQDRPDVLAGALSDCAGDCAPRAIEVYSRLAADRPSFAKVLGPVITAALPDLCTQAIRQAARETDPAILLGTTSLASELARLVAAVPPDPGVLAEVLDGFPSRTDLMLNPLAVVLSDQIADWSRSLAQANPAPYLPALAMSLNSLSVRLAGAGRRGEALAVVEEAVEIRRSLAHATPPPSCPTWPSRSTSCRSAQATPAGGRRVWLSSRRPWGSTAAWPANPAAHLPSLAASVNNLSNRLGDAGRRDEAGLSRNEAAEVSAECRRQGWV
jgi:hypothetical protein